MGLLPSEEVALKKTLLAIRQRVPSGPALTIKEATDEDDRGEPFTFLLIELPGSNFYCRVFRHGIRSEPNLVGDNGGFHSASSFEHVIKLVDSWAAFAYREFSALLELRALDKEFGGAGVGEYAEAPDGEMFTDTERTQIDVDLMAVATQIGARFDSLKGQVGGVDSKVDQLAEQQARILDAIERLGEASNKMSKKDWSNIALGTAVSIVASAVIPPEAARAMVQDFLGQLAHIKLLPPAA